MNDVERLVAQVARMPGLTNNYRPQRSCGQGYVFTHVCDSVHRGGLQAAPPPAQGDPPGPWQGDPPRDLAGRTPPPRPPGTWQGEPPQTRQTPPSPGPPPTRQTPPRDLAGRTPLDLSGRIPPGTWQTPPRTCQGEPPPGPGRENPPGTWQGEPPPPGPGRENPLPPGRRLQHTVTEWPVRILLECILVIINQVRNSPRHHFKRNCLM